MAAADKIDGSITVRFASPEDAETIHRLIVELAIYEREPNAVIVTPDDLRAQIASGKPPFECLLAEDGDEALGFALFFPNYSTWLGKPGLFIEDIYVPDKHRCRGVGMALFRTLEEIARERDYGRIEWSVLKWNELAIGFYERIGAQPLDEWLGFRYLVTEDKNKE